MVGCSSFLDEFILLQLALKGITEEEPLRLAGEVISRVAGHLGLSDDSSGSEARFQVVKAFGIQK